MLHCQIKMSMTGISISLFFFMGFFFIMGFLCIAGPFIISRYFWKDIPSSDSKNEEQIELEDIN